MIYKSFAVISVLTLLSAAAAHAGSAPPKNFTANRSLLRGVEQRSQRRFGEVNFSDANVSLSRMIYVSTKGQWFHRFTAGAGSRQVIGVSGTNNSGGIYQEQFSGRTIIGTGAGNTGLARRFTIEFNESFTTCEAHVIFAKQAGHDVVVGHNIGTGAADNEIRSSTVTSVSCSVRDGNVFAQ